MKKIESKVAPFDVLLLHGRDLPLVETLEKILTSIGLTAFKVVDLPSHNLGLAERVNVYIKASRLRIVVASFDETQEAATMSRPNVYDEITRCLIKASKNSLLVLQETKNGKEVELPTNVGEELLKVRIPFERTNFAIAVPKLFREIKFRGLLKPSLKKSDPDRATATILNPFMSKMDAIWEKELTVGWNKVHSTDANAVSKLTSHLDNFFIQYHKVFKALIRKNKRGEDLIPICEKVYEKSVGYAVLTWTVVADSKHDQAVKLYDDVSNSRFSEIYEVALHEYRQIERAKTEKNKIERAKRAVAQFESYIKTIKKLKKIR
jgi:hypothetical protein